LQKMTIELEQKNNVLKAILKAMPDTISRLDYAGKYLDYMPAQNEGNIPVAAFIGNYLKDIVPLNAIDDVLFAFKKTLKLGEIQVANFQHYQNNMPQFYEARFAPIEQLDEVLCIIRNITDQIAAKDALQKSLAYYRLLIENTLTPLLTVRLDGTIIDLNKAALSLLKVPHKTALVHQNITSFLSKKSEVFQVKDLLKRVATDKLPESGRSFTIKDLNENQLELHVQGSVLELNRELVIQLSLQSVTQTP
ncbi:MAG: PAS domain-containing protein, partial [Chitinophagales bacterium]